MKFNEGDLIYYKPLHIETKREEGIVKKVYGNPYQFKSTMYEILILSSGVIKLAKIEELEVRKYG